MDLHLLGTHRGLLALGILAGLYLGRASIGSPLLSCEGCLSVAGSLNSLIPDMQAFAAFFLWGGGGGGGGG